MNDTFKSAPILFLQNVLFSNESWCLNSNFKLNILCVLTKYITFFKLKYHKIITLKNTPIFKT